MTPAVVGVATMPYVIRRIGTEAFGVLSLAWLMLGIFAVLDFGASRAATKRIAELRAAGTESGTGPVVWTALALNLGISALGAIAMIAGSGAIVVRVLEVPPALQAEAQTVFWLLGLTIPATLAAGVLRSALEGAQRFDVTTLVQVPANAMNFVWPAIVVAFGGGLVPVVACICATRFALVPIFLAACHREFRALGRPRIDRDEGSFLLRFGGWMTVSSVIGPILVNLDRVLVGALLGVRSVGFYAAPYEAVLRLTMIPASLMSALFPALSGLATGRPERLAAAYRRAVRYILGIMVPICGALVAVAPELLLHWLGPDFVVESAGAVQLLAVGLLALALGSLPFNLLQATGRADAAARVHAAELVPYAVVAWQLVANFGIVGAAAAWALRATADCILFHVTAQRLYVGVRLGLGEVVLALGLFGAAATVVTAAAVLRAAQASLAVLLIMLASAAALYAYGAWRYVLDVADRERLVTWVHRRRSQRLPARGDA